MFRRFILAKFLAYFVPVFLLFTGASIYFIAERHIATVSNQIGARIGSQAGKVTNLLSQELVSNSPKVAAKLISTLMTDPAITCVEPFIAGERVPNLAQPIKLGLQSHDTGKKRCA